MNVLVGCPVLRREWIIDRWMTAAAFSADAAGATPAFVLVVDPHDPTLELAIDTAEHLGVQLTYVPVTEARTEDVRDWHTEGRYLRMANLRNQLLAVARSKETPLLWSLDSDIIAAPGAFKAMADQITAGADAAASCCFLSQSTNNPNFCEFAGAPGTSRYSRRHQPNATISVDVIMANKLMSPSAYAVDYGYHRSGEDIAWSEAAKARGLRLVWIAEPVSKHVMHPKQLDVLDARCGY